jgi:hypothetical protein
MEIAIGIGIGELLFGFTESKVKEILGLEDKLYLTDLGCRRLQFYNEMLELSFEPDNDGLLGWIEVHNPEAILFKQKLLGQTKDKVLELLVAKLGQPSGYDDYGSFDTAFYEEQWLELHFHFGRLTNLNIGVLYGEDNEILWPTLVTQSIS